MGLDSSMIFGQMSLGIFLKDLIVIHYHNLGGIRAVYTRV
jgi:hypothetical protein